MTLAPSSEHLISALNKHEVDIPEFNELWYRTMILGDPLAAESLHDLLLEHDAFGLVRTHLDVKLDQIVLLIRKPQREQLRRCGHAVINLRLPVAIRYAAHRQIHDLLTRKDPYGDLLYGDLAYPGIEIEGWLGERFYLPRFELALSAYRDEAIKAELRRTALMEAATLFKVAEADLREWDFSYTAENPFERVPVNEMSARQAAECDISAMFEADDLGTEEVFARCFNQGYGADTYSELMNAATLYLGIDRL